MQIIDPNIIVAIDFGTTRSAVAIRYFSNTKNKLIDKLLEWKNYHRFSHPKIPTTIAYKLSGEDWKQDSVSYEADIAALENKRDSFIYIKYIKLKLCKKNKYPISTERIVMDYLTFLKNKVDEYLSQDGFKNKKIVWCVTVPAIWTFQEKQFMEDTALKAFKTSKKYLVLVLEPEAAAERFFNHISKVQDSVKNSFIVLTVDAGGGTIDITLSKCSKNCIEEIIAADGNKMGGIFVNKNILKLLKSQFDKDAFNEWKKNHPTYYEKILQEIEIKKLFLKYPMEIQFDINRSLYNLKRNDVPPTELLLITEYNEEYYIKYTKDQVAKCFNLVLDDAKNKIRNMLSEAKKSVNNLDYIWFVGGFSNSDFFRESITEVVKKFYNKLKYIKPHSYETAIVEGALSFGYNPSIVSFRVLRYTYGIMAMEKWDNNKHFGQKKWKNPETSENMCSNVLHILANKSERYSFNMSKKYTVQSTYKDQKLLNLAFYSSNKNLKSPVFVPQNIDEDIQLAGQIIINLPDGNLQKNRDIEIEIFFGHSNIDAIAYLKSNPQSYLVTTLKGGNTYDRLALNHIIFCIDCSDSMYDPSPRPFSSCQFSKTHNNRLGAAFQACEVFIKQREIDSPQIFCDLYSIVFFAHKAIVHSSFELLNSQSFIDKMIPLKSKIISKVGDISRLPSTDYNSALQQILSNKLLEKENDKRRNVIIFLSDGEDLGDSNSRESSLDKILLIKDTVLHTVHVGTDNKENLTEMAKRGNGTFTEVGVDLKKLLRTFELLAGFIRNSQ